MLTLPAHRDWVTALAITPDGRFGASGSFGWTVKRWDLDQGIQLDELRAWPGYSLGEGHGDEVRSVGISSDGIRLAVVTDDSHLRTWDTSTRDSVSVRRGSPDEDWRAAMTPDGRLAAGSVHFALVSTDGEGSPGAITVWDLERGETRRVLTGHPRLVEALAFSCDGSRLVSATEDGVLQVWDVGRGDELGRLHVGPVSALAVNGDGSIAAAAGKEGGPIVLLDLDPPAQKQILEESAGANGLAMTPDGRIVAAACGDGAVRVWGLPATRPAAVLRAHAGAVVSVGCTADGGLVLSGGSDRTVRAWEPGRARDEMRDGGPPVPAPGRREPQPGQIERLRELCREVAEGDLRDLFSASVSADCRFAVTATREYRLLSGAHELGIDTGAVRLWDLAAGRQLRALAVRSENVYGFGKAVWFRAVVIADDGSHVAAADEAGVVTVWRADGSRVAAFTADGAVDSVAWALDGRVLVARDALGSVHVLELVGGDGQP